MLEKSRYDEAQLINGTCGVDHADKYSKLNWRVLRIVPLHKRFCSTTYLFNFLNEIKIKVTQ